MNAPAFKITVARGPQQGHEFLLTRRITRLGSDAGCEICIPVSGLAGHALSIENRDDHAIVYNRSEQSLTLAGAAVPSGDSGTWKLGKELTLPGDVILRLEKYVAHSSAPAKVSLSYEVNDVASPDDESHGDVTLPKPSQDSKAKSNTGPLIFVAGCAVLIVLLIMKKVGSDPNAPTAARPDALTWTKVWEEINNPERLNDPAQQEIRRGLQHLYRHQANDSAPEYIRWKSRILQSLIATVPNDDVEREFNERLRGFVNDLD